jgi:hypothetical protein
MEKRSLSRKETEDAIRRAHDKEREHLKARIQTARMKQIEAESKGEHHATR